MKSVEQFNSKQKANFNFLLSDISGPTMSVFLLQVIEALAYQLAQPDIDPNWISEDVKEDAEVCFAALEYYRMVNIEGEK